MLPDHNRDDRGHSNGRDDRGQQQEYREDYPRPWNGHMYRSGVANHLNGFAPKERQGAPLGATGVIASQYINTVSPRHTHNSNGAYGGWGYESAMRPQDYQYQHQHHPNNSMFQVRPSHIPDFTPSMQGGPNVSSPTTSHFPTNSYPSRTLYDNQHVNGMNGTGVSDVARNALLANVPQLSLQSTLIADNLEAWMDDQYLRSACTVMGWNPVDIQVPRPTEPEDSQPLANNYGYGFLVFNAPSQAAAVLASFQNGSSSLPNMPNSTRSFSLNWADRIPVSQLMQRQASAAVNFSAPRTQPEYSIFVGDLAPEATNADLVAVFKNPILGLRSDRQPKYVAPFTSCKSAKIMLDSSGVSKGYGFVR
jgi:hypothetical protein